MSMRFGIVGSARMGLEWPAAKMVALLRNQYGGHPIHREDEDEDRR
jgi:hypothetical protein